MSSEQLGLLAWCSESFDFNRSFRQILQRPINTVVPSAGFTGFALQFIKKSQQAVPALTPRDDSQIFGRLPLALMSLVPHRRPRSLTQRPCTRVHTFLCDSKPVSCELITQLWSLPRRLPAFESRRDKRVCRGAPTVEIIQKYSLLFSLWVHWELCEYVLLFCYFTEKDLILFSEQPSF